MTRDTAERARELAERYLLPGEGSNKDELIGIIKSGLTQVQAEARLEEAKSVKANYEEMDGAPFEKWLDKRIAALAQALQLEEKEGTC